jgi:hypothetical protein
VPRFGLRARAPPMLSRVNSSHIDSALTGRLSTVVSKKSMAQTWLGFPSAGATPTAHAAAGADIAPPPGLAASPRVWCRVSWQAPGSRRSVCVAVAVSARRKKDGSASP